jgi:TRAP-type C4-dicarboxylate transport system permease small subunit
MTALVSRALRVIDVLCDAGAAVAAICAILLAALLMVEVIATSTVGWSQPWTVEYSLYLQSIVLFGGAGWALRNGGHVRVPMLIERLRPTSRRLLEIALAAFGLGVTGFCAYALVDQAVRTAAFGSRSFYPMATPLWIPQSALAAAFVLFALACFARLVRLAIGESPEIASHVGGSIE